MTPSRSLDVAVIGAGGAGLVAARELRREGHAPVVFERGAAVGGIWVYEDVPASAADDPLGASGVHSSLYASLRTNLPRECMGFLDFPFVADAGTMSSYSDDPRRFPGHAEVLRYLEAFARWFDLHGLVRLETEVVGVRRDDASAGWKVSYCSRRKLAGAGSEEPTEVVVEEEVFDAVVVCSGHSTEPRVADIAGIDGWPGKQMHSHTYRVPDPFHGKDVVVVGYAPSGVDISRDIVGVAKEVHVARRSPATSEMQSTAHANLWLHPMSLQFPLFQLQSNWVAGVLSGRIDLPSQEEMMEDVAAFYSELEAAGCPKRYTHDLGACTYEYEDWVAEQCGQERIEGWRKEMFVAALKNFPHRTEIYRDEWDDDHLLSQAHRDFAKYF